MSRYVGVCVVCMAIAGCGGASSPKISNSSAAQEVVNQYLRAFKSKDWSTACNDISAAARQKIQIDAGGTGCAATFAAIDRKDARVAQLFNVFGSATVENVSTHGDSGVASISVVGKTLKVPLVKEDGAWKLQSGAV